MLSPLVTPQGRPQRPLIAGSPDVQSQSSQLHMLDVRRGELKSQLTSNTERRALLSVQMHDATGAQRSQLEARIKALDDRTASIDDQLNSIDDAMNRALAAGNVDVPAPVRVFDQGRTITVMPPGQSRGNVGEIVAGVMFTEALAFSLVMFVMWRWLKRRPIGAVKLAAEDASRISELQRAVDVIALEVERISESQRFIAKTLNEKALPVGAERERSR